MLVVADAVLFLTPAGPLVDGCRSSHVSVVAPVLLGCGGLFVVLALAAMLVGAPPGYPGPRWALFLTLWVFVTLAYAVSAFGMDVFNGLTICF